MIASGRSFVVATCSLSTTGSISCCVLGAVYTGAGTQPHPCIVCVCWAEWFRSTMALHLAPVTSVVPARSHDARFGCSAGRQGKLMTAWQREDTDTLLLG